MESFVNKLAQFGDQTALLSAETGEKVSYAQLALACDQFSKQLPATHTKSLIALASTNSIPTIVSYLSCLQSGHAVLLYDASMDESLRKALLTQYQPDLSCVEGILTPLATSQPAPALHPNLALCLSTSGSTGSPKLVKLTLNNVQANTEAICAYLPLSAEEVAITVLPFHYSYGLSVLNTHLAVGASIVLTNESIITRSFWDIFKRYQVSSLSGVPFHYEMLERLSFRDLSLPSLRYLSQAGGKLPIHLVKKFTEYAKDKAIAFYQMYGQTEATARMAYLPPAYAAVKPGSIGKAIPGGIFSILDERGQFIEEEEKIGELVYQGANVMMGYAYHRADLAKGDELNGVLKTGDLAKRDKDGFFYIEGRLKRFLKIHGNRVGLDELELALKQQNFDCICGGKDNQLVVLTKNKMMMREIEDLLSQKYHLHHTTYKVIWKEHFPVSSSGKIQYQQLQELAYDSSR